MEAVLDRCCGLDVHKKSVVACVITPGGRELADWLRVKEVSHVAMESTGVYWKPVYNLLEDEFGVMVVNAAHMKTVPGRRQMPKTLNGLQNCSNMVCCGPASSRRGRSGN